LPLAWLVCLPLAIAGAARVSWFGRSTKAAALRGNVTAISWAQQTCHNYPLYHCWSEKVKISDSLFSIAAARRR
jgi:hypothetical protein